MEVNFNKSFHANHYYFNRIQLLFKRKISGNNHKIANPQIMTDYAIDNINGRFSQNFLQFHRR